MKKNKWVREINLEKADNACDLCSIPLTKTIEEAREILKMVYKACNKVTNSRYSKSNYSKRIFFFNIERRWED